MSNFFLSLLLFFSIFSVRGNENNTTIKILRYKEPFYLINVRPDLSYFINGDIIIKTVDKTFNLLIKDSNNSNDIILVKESESINLLSLCNNGKCTGNPKFYKKFANVKTEKKEIKSSFLSSGLVLTDDLDIEKKKHKTFGGPGVSYDMLFYRFKFFGERLRIGANLNLMYSNFHYLDSSFSDDFGSEKVHVLNVSLNPGIYFFPFDWLGFFATPALNYSLISYSLDEPGIKQKATGGFALGSAFGGLVILGDYFISGRVQNIPTKINFESSISGEELITNSYSVIFNNIFISGGVSF